MGLATANAFAEAGAAVVLADYKEEDVNAAGKELVAAGRKAIAVRCDLSDDADSTRRSTTRGSWPASSRPPAALAKTGIV
jgi:NAD(P)-dependent dehydrogenase (short-subunit alcohol dehydrogenase family)